MSETSELERGELDLLRKLAAQRRGTSLHLDLTGRRIYDRMRRAAPTRDLLMERVDSWGMISPAGRDYLAALPEGGT